jgi:hypothetical protein
MTLDTARQQSPTAPASPVLHCRYLTVVVLAVVVAQAGVPRLAFLQPSPHLVHEACSSQV